MKTPHALLSTAELATCIAPGAGRPGEFVVLDCRFVLSDTEAGAAAYLEGHVPGAVYVHLERDLSGPPSSDHGRHPLPPPARMAAVFGQLGIGPATRVVAYDDSFGMVAARVWWMLRYMGHAAVSVLDGGWQAWVAGGYPITCGSQFNSAQDFAGVADRARLVCVDEVAQAALLLDAREAPRYRGELEPIDPRAGHIPGARNHCWKNNLGADGCLLPASELRAGLLASLDAPATTVVTHYCGSGVSACHNILAAIVAGLPEPRLYCGSWSEWCRDDRRRVMMGAEPGTW